jgi:ribosomal protein S18 acetylase RimI-like enzyme
MTASPFRFEILSGEHEREGFHCGEDALDTYFRRQVTQDVRRRVANCFVIVEISTAQVAAFYTLSAASIPLLDLPHEEAKRLPRYPALPAVRIGRLAVDRRFRRRGLGELMFMNAVHRTLSDVAAASALLVDAKDDTAVAFYRKYGFSPIVGKSRTLFLPLANAQKTLLGPSRQ